MNNNDMKTSVGAREKLPFWFGAAWSGRSVSVAVCMALMGYTAYYCTDVVGMNPTLVGILLMVSKLFDGFTDLVVGFVIDRTNTKLGKARPYELTIILLWIFSVMLFATPSDFSQIGKAIWVFVMYTLVNSIWITILYGNETAYLMRAVLLEKNKVKLTAVSGIYILLFSTVVAMVMPQAVKAAGTRPQNWVIMTVSLAIPCVLIGILRFLFIKEIKVESEPVKLNLKEGISAVGKNKYIWIFSIMYFCYQLANNINCTAGAYYNQYVYGDIGVGTYVSMGMILVPILLIFVPKVMERMGTRKTLQIGFLIMIVGLGLRMVGGAALLTLVIGSTLFMIGYVPIAFMLNVYLFECMDYGYWKKGKKVEAMINSVTSFVAKIGSALASASVGLFMGMAGYDGSLAVQPNSAVTVIKLMYNVIPMIIIVIALFVSLKYDLEKKLPDIRKEISESE